MNALMRLLDKIGTGLYDLFVGPSVLEKELRRVSDRIDALAAIQAAQLKSSAQLVELAEQQLAALDAIHTLAESGHALDLKSAKALAGIADRIGQIGPHT